MLEESTIVFCVMTASAFSSGLTSVSVMLNTESRSQMSLLSHIIRVYLSEGPGSFLTTGRSD
jgi:hypothetical protein